MKNSNSVAVERRMDLASLFCMIGRHGPAVALAVIALVSVLAGFIIYRTVRGKRRKAAAAESEDKSPEAERDASVMLPSPGECHLSTASTDVSEEGSSDAKEDVDVLKIRHRKAAAAAAEKKPPPYSPPKSDIQAPENKHTTSDDKEEMANVWDSYKERETYAEEANQRPPSDTYTVTEMVAENAFDYRQDTTNDTKDVIEEVCGNDSHLKEPEPINDEIHKGEEKVLQAECQEAEDVTTDKNISDQKTGQEEENFQCCLNNPVCFERSPHMGKTGENDRPEHNITTVQTNSESNSDKPLIYNSICYGKDEWFEEENSDRIDYSSYSGNVHVSPEEEKKNEGERAEEECVDYQDISQQAEMWSSTLEQETNLPSSQQDQCDHLMDKVMPPIQDSDWNEDGGLAGEVIEEAVDEDHSSKSDTHSPQFEEQEVELEQKEECDRIQEDGANRVEEKMLTSDSIIARSEERDSSSVALSCLSIPVKDDNYDKGLPGVTIDGNAQISSTAVFPDLSVTCQPQKEDNISTHGPQMSSHETENPPENNRNGRTVLAEECTDQMIDPHVQSCYKDHQSVQMANNEVSGKLIIAAESETVEDSTACAIAEEISCPHPPPICEDQQSDRMENDETRVTSATEAVVCNNTHLTALSVPEEITHPGMLSSFQDQQSDHMENNEIFSEVPTSAVPINTKDKIYLSPFEQSGQRDHDLSPSVGEESGISSLAVSPDVQDGNEFDMTVGNMVFPVMNHDLWSEGQTEPQNTLFSDDVAIPVINDTTTGMVFGSYPSHCSRESHSEHTNWIKYESFAANEDMFGHEIEDGYHRAMDHFTAQVTASVTSYTDDLKIQTDMKAVIEVVEIKEKSAGVHAEKEEDTKSEKEKEEDTEKTEISIMEATMDHNEWITESNYQILPWMNLSVLSFDRTKTNQLPAEECQSSSAATVTTCIDTTDIPPSTEVKQTSPLSLADENTETNKKVVAVQPMPQNVNVTFRVHYFTQSPYQTVAVTGNHQELGNWKGFIPLERVKDGHWATVVTLPTESHVEWKFVVLEKGEVCRWEECGNRLLDTGYGDDLLVHKWWGLL
uniref:uncharacterized protein stbd1 n=1 Tax=Scatophagus argus TaxID=75038 RepID=UPI001ED8547A|nr:uncharacterized protein stbd1 [Scatophagus argus]